MSCRRSTDATESPDLCEQHAIFTGQLMQRMYDVWEPGLGEKSRENIHTSVRFGLQQRPRHIVWYFRPHLDFFEKRNAESCGNPLTTYCDQERLRVFQEEFAILQTVCSEDWINRQ
jgi:hypothetical protein